MNVRVYLGGEVNENLGGLGGDLNQVSLSGLGFRVYSLGFRV